MRARPARLGASRSPLIQYQSGEYPSFTNLLARASLPTSAGGEAARTPP